MVTICGLDEREFGICVPVLFHIGWEVEVGMGKMTLLRSCYMP
jgi:hypothetical protein